MTIQQLEYVVALDTHRHFVQAADHCFVTQPTLTMQVQKLEQEIGITLFDRSKKPLEPTKAGAPIIAKIRSILLEINQLKSFVYNEKESLEGTYRLGIIPTVSPYLLPLFLQDFTTKYPEVNLQIREIQTAQIIDALKQGTLDIGILATPLMDQHFRLSTDSKDLDKPKTVRCTKEFREYVDPSRVLPKLGECVKENLPSELQVMGTSRRVNWR